MAASCVPSFPAKLPRTDTNCSDGEIYHIRIGTRLGLVLVLGVEVLQVVPVLDRSKCLDSLQTLLKGHGSEQTLRLNMVQVIV